MMKKSSCSSAFALLMIFAHPVHAQRTGTPTAVAELDDILENGTADRDIPPEKRSDLSSCSGTDEAGLVKAINHCWPVLQTYRLYSALRPAGGAWKALPAHRLGTDTVEAQYLARAIEGVIQSAEGRPYPAQDLPLTAAYILKSTLSFSRRDTEGTLSALATAREIATTSAVEGFDTGGFVDLIDRRAAEAKKAMGIPQ